MALEAHRHRRCEVCIALLTFFAKFCTPNTYGDGETKPTEVLVSQALQRRCCFRVAKVSKAPHTKGEEYQGL